MKQEESFNRGVVNVSNASRVCKQNCACNAPYESREPDAKFIQVINHSLTLLLSQC